MFLHHEVVELEPSEVYKTDPEDPCETYKLVAEGSESL